MRVDRLVVVVFESGNKIEDENIRKDGFALAYKHQNKYGKAPVFKKKAYEKEKTSWSDFANGKVGYDLAGLKAGYVGAHNVIVLRSNNEGIIGLENVPKFLRGSKACGIYLLMHGRQGQTTPFKEGHGEGKGSPTSIANIVKSIMAGASDTPLLKVNLCACTLAATPSKNPTAKTLKKELVDLGDAATFAGGVCRALQRPETMVAGYQVQVHIGRDANIEFDDFAGSGKQESRPAEATIGRKAVTWDIEVEGVKRPQTVTQKINGDNRGEIKRIYQLKKGIVSNIPLAEYHAYGRE